MNLRCGTARRRRLWFSTSRMRFHRAWRWARISTSTTAWQSKPAVLARQTGVLLHHKAEPALRGQIEILLLDEVMPGADGRREQVVDLLEAIAQEMQIAERVGQRRHGDLVIDRTTLGGRDEIAVL